jgi:hypothetical protein
VNVGIIEGDLDGLRDGDIDGILVGTLLGVHDGAHDGMVLGVTEGLTVGIDVGNMDGDMEGVLVGALGIPVGDDVGTVVPVGSHFNTYLSYELKAILDITRYSNSPLKYPDPPQFIPICPVDTLAIFLAELTNVFIATLFL